METLMTGIVLLCGLLYVIGKIRDCNINPEYEEWITEDKIKYPELYEKFN